MLGSRGEFTVAKDQNVRLRSGWFSDRSATYLAAGRPVITEETGFSNVLPTGEGLFGFSDRAEALDAVERVNGDYGRHCRAAEAVAAEHFDSDSVLGDLLEAVGLGRTSSRTRVAPEPDQPVYPAEMELTPVSRRPTRLPDATVETVLARPVPGFEGAAAFGPSRASIVIVTYDNLVFNRLCLEALLAGTSRPTCEVIVIDNGSRDGSSEYLRRLAARQPQVRVVLNEANVGFAAACNQGLALASGEILVLLNNDTLVPPGWLTRLDAHLEDPAVGLVGACTNRIGNEAEVDAAYGTWGGFLDFDARRSAEHAGESFDIGTATMFCLAFRRETYERIGPLDERFEVGLLEDDDYSRRARAAGYRVVCADDAFVHHFGETSFGKLVLTGEYARVLTANRKRFEEKWGAPWEPYSKRSKPEYRQMTERIADLVLELVPSGATVLVLSRGDEKLLELGGRRAWHFPQTDDGVYAGHHPADSREAIARLEALRARGGEFLLLPETGMWWLDYYADFRRHLETHYSEVAHRADAGVLFELDSEGR